MTRAFIIAARRTPVAPRGGALSAIGAADLGAAVITALIADTTIALEHFRVSLNRSKALNSCFAAFPDGEPVPTSPGNALSAIDGVIMGNALYGGGNPARVAALAGGLPETCPALTLDTQCCAGLDAIGLAASRIAAGDADILIAGGLESMSRAPLRARRPAERDGAPVFYDRPPFTPWPDRDPEMIEAAAMLARETGITRERQEAYAVASHARARANPPMRAEIVPLAGVHVDGFTRALSVETCARLPVLAGDADHAITAATTAVAADAAAAVLLVSERVRARMPHLPALEILGYTSMGGDPERPGLAPIAAGRALLARHGLGADAITHAEIMEAYAAQAMACIAGLGLDPDRVNTGGGALARGHPIGASGAILAVRLWHTLKSAPPGHLGLAAIAGAGGLGSAILMRQMTAA